MNQTNAITERENAIATLQHQKPAWLGCNVNNIFPREIKDNVARGFVVDGLPFTPDDAGGKDMFGISWVFEKAQRGSIVIPGHPVLDNINGWEAVIQMPDLEQLDWAAIETRCKPLVRTDMLNSTMVFTGYFERLISILDFENAAIAMIDEDCTAAVHRLFDALTRYYEQLFVKLRTHCGIDMITFHDDWGHQRSTFFSMDTYRTMLLPYLTRVVSACHKNGMLFDFHCCGKVGSLVPLMIEAGVDKWDGQTLNDIWGILEQYGDRLCITLNDKLIEATDAEADAWILGILSHLTPTSGKNIFLPGRNICASAKARMRKASERFFTGRP